MEGNQISKKELLEKLAEISDQLEGLERTLDSSLSEHRKNMMKEYTERLDDCESNIARVEEKFAIQSSLQDHSKKVMVLQNKKLKLELGF